MSDFTQTRSEYLKIMMGDRDKALAPYRPERINDLGDTSFDVASLSDVDIDNAINMMSGTKYENSDVFKAFQDEKANRNGKSESDRPKSWLENVGDFFSNIGTSITEGIFNVVDDVWDFGVGVGAGLFGGGWFGAKNDFTDWAAEAMTDDRWIAYATKGATQFDVFDKGFWTNEGGYWTDWSYENIQKEQARDYEGMEWLHKGGNFIGEMIPSLLLTYFTGGANLGVTAAAQGGLSFARGMGEGQSRALSEGASFQESAAYGATKGAISGAITATMIGIGGSALGKEGGIGGKVGDFFGDIAKKTGSKGAEIFATKAGEALTHAGFAAASGFTQAMADPFVKQVTYDSDAIANAFGDSEKVKETLTRAGYAALSSAAMSLATSAIREGGSRILKGQDRYRADFYTQKASRAQSRLENELKSLNNDIQVGKKVDIDARMNEIQRLTSEVENYGKSAYEYWDKVDASNPSDSTKESNSYKREVANFGNLVKRKQLTDLIIKNANVKGERPVISYNADGSGEAFIGKVAVVYPANAKTALYSSVDNPNLPEVEAKIVDGKTVLAPTSAEQMQTLAAIASDQTAMTALPDEVALPLKDGSVNVLLKDLDTPEQVKKLALLEKSDLKVSEDGTKTADLGGGKSLVISADGKSAEIISSMQEQEALEIKQPISNENEVVRTNATPSEVKQMAEGKEGKVYSLSSVNSTIDAIKDSIQGLLSLDNLGGETKLNLPKNATARDVFNALNLGNDEQKVAAKANLKNQLLNMDVDYKLKDYYGDELESYSGTWKDFLATMSKEEIAKFDSDFNEFFDELVASGDDSKVSKLISAYGSKISEMANAHSELKAQTKLHGHIEKHKVKILNRYYHNDGTDFGPGFDFDTKGFKVLLELLHELQETSGKQSYTGSSAHEGLVKFLDNYKLDNFSKTTIDDGNEIVEVNSIYNQGLRDLASTLLTSIEDNSYTDKNGKVIYRALNSNQLSMLRVFQDEVEQMPKRAATDAVEAVSSAKAAYHGVERYVSKFLKNGEIGTIRKFIQGYSERYANQLDTIRYEIGDNALSKAIYDDLYLSASQARGMDDDFQGKINAVREEEGVSNKKLNSLSSFKDTNGKSIENRYLVRVYQHLMAGVDSNNVKYLEANTVYIKNPKGRIEHVCKFSYADKDEIESGLKKAGLLEYAKKLHEIESKDLGDIYDSDYNRDTHLRNSNRLKDYTAIKLESNRSELGKAYVKSGVAKYGQQKDRVTNIPKGVHLIVADPESTLMAQVRNQANIHFNDPVLKKINAMLNTKIDNDGRTVKEYLTQNNRGAVELINRAVNGAYGINDNKQHKLIDFVGNGYVMSLIGLNPSSILKQPLSIFWSNDISMASVLKFSVGANLNPVVWKNTSRLIKEIEEEFPELKLRGKKNEALIGNTSSDNIGKVQKAIGKVAGAGLKMADAWTVGHEAIGVLSLQGQKLGYGDVGTAENDAYVKTHYRAFLATQVSSNGLTMSGARAGYYGGMGKLTSFMTGAVQGQIGHLLRAAQQISEFAGKDQQFYDSLIERTKADEESAKKAYEESQTALKQIVDDYDKKLADKDDVKEAKENLKDAFDKFTKASGERTDAEESAKAFRHFKDMGGAKVVVVNRIVGALLTGISLVAINELASRLKGQKRWDEFDASSAGTDLAINTLGGWLPVARDLVNAWKGYDLEIPEYAMMKQAYTLVTAISNAAQNPSDKTARALMRQAIESASAFLGIPTTNLWKYANGIIKTFSPSTAIEMNNLLYGASPTTLAKNAKEYAEKNDISTSADLYQSLYSLSKTGEISREVAVEESKLVAEGFNPIARNIPDYVQGDDGERVMLTDDQRSDFSKIYSEANKQVEKLIKIARYKNATSEVKAKEIKKVYDLYYEVARYKSLGTDPDSKLGKLLAYASSYDDDVIATLLLIQQNSQLVDNARSTKKEQAIKLVNQQTMSKMQKLLTLYLMGYGVSEDNKKVVRNYLISLGFTKKQAEEFLPTK